MSREELIQETPLFIKRRGVILTDRGYVILNLLRGLGFLSLILILWALMMIGYSALHS